MLDMGFKPAVDRIVAQTPRDRQTLFFSATLDGEAGRIAEAFTRDARRHEEAPPQRAEAKIEHRFVAVERTERVETLVAQLNERERDLALVFVRTKRGADRLVKSLARSGVNAVAMHGDKSQKPARARAREFEAGRVDTLVATDVAARGIDVDDISHVIQFDAPDGRDTYVHRVGRTGRAGRTGVGITYVQQRDGRGRRADRERAAARRASSARPASPAARRPPTRPARRSTRGRRAARRAGAGGAATATTARVPFRA